MMDPNKIRKKIIHTILKYLLDDDLSWKILLENLKTKSNISSLEKRSGKPSYGEKGTGDIA